MSVTVDYKFSLTTKETLSSIDGATNTQIDYSQFDVGGRLNSTSTPPATKVCYVTIEATGTDSGTIDLTALPGPLDSVIDATGLKLRMIRITNLSASVGSISLYTGATNGYPLSSTYLVYPGGCLEQLFGSELAAVSGSAKTIDWDSTDDFEVQLTLIFG